MNNQEKIKELEYLNNEHRGVIGILMDEREVLRAEIEKLKSEVGLYRTDAEKLITRLADCVVNRPVKELSRELLDKTIIDQQNEIKDLRKKLDEYLIIVNKPELRQIKGINYYVDAQVKADLTDEEWKLLEKVINDCAETIEYRIDVERLAFKGYEHCSELESLYEEQNDASKARAILRKAQEK